MIPDVVETGIFTTRDIHMHGTSINVKRVLYNGDEQVCFPSNDFISYLVGSKYFTIPENRFLVWYPGILVALIFDKEISVIHCQTVKKWDLNEFTYAIQRLDPFCPNAIILENILLQNFEPKKRMINKLKKFKNLESATRYLLKEMTLNVV